MYAVDAQFEAMVQKRRFAFVKNVPRVGEQLN